MTTNTSRLPKTDEDFHRKEYWDDFFKKSANTPFEWYGDWKADITPLLESRALVVLPESPFDKVIVLGCGNSNLSAQLVLTQFSRHVTSVDFSKLVIEAMRERMKRWASQMDWVVADFLDMRAQFPEGKSFGCAVDKGALDAVYADRNNVESPRKLLDEVVRLVSHAYVCITLLESQVLDFVRVEFARRFGKIEIRSFTPKKGSALCPFAVVASEIRDGVSEDEPPTRWYVNGIPIQDSLEVVRRVTSLQKAYAVKREMRRGLSPGEVVGKFVVEGTSSGRRYSVTVADCPPLGESGGSYALPLAALVAPLGHEREWAFASREGVLELASTNRIQRLVVVRTWGEVPFSELQSDLSKVILEDLAPPSLDPSFRIPFLAARVAGRNGEPGVVKKRTLLCEIDSSMSGKLRVEEEEADEEERSARKRLLVFARSPLEDQSECLVVDGRVDASHLAFDFHRAMLFGARAALLGGTREARRNGRALVVGLGGGGLVMKMKEEFPRLIAQQDDEGDDDHEEIESLPRLDVVAVELDGVVVQIARKWFGFPEEGVHVVVGDGLEHLRSLHGNDRFDLVVLDVNGGGDENEGGPQEEGEEEEKEPDVISFPPRSFLEPSLWTHIRDEVLAHDNLEATLALNLGVFSQTARLDVLASFARVFPRCFVIELGHQGDVNVVVFGARAGSGNEKAVVESISRHADWCETLAIRVDGVSRGKSEAAEMRESLYAIVPEGTSGKVRLEAVPVSNSQELPATKTKKKKSKKKKT